MEAQIGVHRGAGQGEVNESPPKYFSVVGSAPRQQAVPRVVVRARLLS